MEVILITSIDAIIQPFLSMEEKEKILEENFYFHAKQFLNEMVESHPNHGEVLDLLQNQLLIEAWKIVDVQVLG